MRCPIIRPIYAVSLSFLLLSPPLRAETEAAKEMKVKVEAVAGGLACEDDLNKNCNTIRAGKGRLVQCIRDQKDRLSDSCKAELGE